MKTIGMKISILSNNYPILQSLPFSCPTLVSRSSDSEFCTPFDDVVEVLGCRAFMGSIFMTNELKIVID